MFHWYKESVVCYVYLYDVPMGCPCLSDLHGAQRIQWTKTITSSVWFTRAWTLQELLAPPFLVFCSVHWKRICSLHDIVDSVSQSTGIDTSVLLHEAPIASASVSKRMSWASTRSATRIEDIAYSLLGIFDVNMPMLYGEREKSFIRLQETIIRSSTDQSIFAWEHGGQGPSARKTTSPSLLASCPQDFCIGERNVLWRLGGPFELTNAGLKLSTNVLHLHDNHYAAVLNSRCTQIDGADMPHCYVHALKLRKPAYHEDSFYVSEDDCSICIARSSPELPIYSTLHRLLYVDIATARQASFRDATIVQASTKPTSCRPTVVKLHGGWYGHLKVDSAWPASLWNLVTLSMHIPDAFLTPRIDNINANELRYGRDFISGHLKMRYLDMRDIFIVVNVWKRFADILTFDVGFVENEACLPRDCNIDGDLIMKKNMLLDNTKYHIRLDGSDEQNNVLYVELIANGL